MTIVLFSVVAKRSRTFSSMSVNTPRREDGLPCASAIKFSLLQLCTDSVAPQVLGKLLGGWPRHFSTADHC